MGGYPELTKCCCRRLNEKWSDPEFNLESDEDNCLQGLEDDTPRGPSIDAVDLKHALGILTSVPNLMNPLGTMSLSALGKVLEQELPPPKSYPQSVHRVVSTLLISRRNISIFLPRRFPLFFPSRWLGTSPTTIRAIQVFLDLLT